MPVQTGPSCIASLACPITPLPPATAVCSPLLSYGGINDLYFVPCTESLTQVNILDTSWWTTLNTAGNLGNIGSGLGSIGKKSVKTERLASCLPEQAINATWALKYIIKTFDKTSTDATTTQINTLLTNFRQFQAIARMCDGDDVVLPIGRFTVSDFDWTVPDNFEDVQTISLEIAWIEFAKPKIYTVTGLSAIVPKS